MIEKTKKNFPNIYNIYNNPPENDINEIKPKNIYLTVRSILLPKLQNLINRFDYYDQTFYQCLFFLDIFLSHDISIEMSEKTILYYFIGYFLCSLKLKETDIYEPEFDSFFELEKGILFPLIK